MQKSKTVMMYYNVCDHVFVYKKQVCKKQRFKHNFVSQEPIYNAIITVKQKFVNLTASWLIW